mgnify:CR=1 FL=1
MNNDVFSKVESKTKVKKEDIFSFARSIQNKDLKDEDFDNLIYLPDNCEITIKLNSTNELDYLNSVKQFLDKLDKLDKKSAIFSSVYYFIYLV